MAHAGGRPPKPTHLKLLEGNPGKRPINKNEPKPLPISPASPAWMRSSAKTMWKTLAPQLEKLGLLTSIDGAALSAACEAYATWAYCEKKLIKNGLTIELSRIDENGKSYVYCVQSRPEVSIGNKALVAFKSFCTEFGLTPSSRSGINIKQADDEVDPMEAILRKKGGG